MDVDSTGGAVTAAMVAGALEKPTGQAGAHGRPEQRRQIQLLRDFKPG